MLVLMNTGGVAATNCFVLADEGTGEAVLFDAPDHTVARVLNEVERLKLKLVGLWLTHGHFDHIADHAVVTYRFPNAKVLIHPLDAPKLRRPESTIFPLPFTIPPREPDGFVEDRQDLRIGGKRVEVIHTPGHAPGHVMYHVPDDLLLVGGDLIILNAVGRTDLPDSDPQRLADSIRRVMRLPPDTRLLPGHGEMTTLAEQREVNPYVRDALRGRPM
jgi:hydroxyacylglutathione hydrolase